MLILIAFLCKEGYDELNTTFKELNKKHKKNKKHRIYANLRDNPNLNTY